MLLPVLSLVSAGAWAEVVAVDDTGERVALEAPARRIVALTPHATELLFAAGAGQRVVGVSAYSDHPPAARALPRVGGAGNLDLEGIVALRPDLVVAWASGNPAAQLQRLRDLGIAVFTTRPRRLADIPDAVQALGRLAGTSEVADPAAQGLRRRLGDLRARYGGQRAVRVFYQVWHRPVVTLGAEHLVSRALETCGGENVFAALDGLAPQVGVEAVLLADPEVIVASADAQGRPAWLDDWREWPRLTAVREGHLYALPPDLLQRPGPRFVDGVAALCQRLERVRAGGLFRVHPHPSAPSASSRPES